MEKILLVFLLCIISLDKCFAPIPSMTGKRPMSEDISENISEVNKKLKLDFKDKKSPVKIVEEYIKYVEANGCMEKPNYFIRTRGILKLDWKPIMDAFPTRASQEPIKGECDVVAEALKQFLGKLYPKIIPADTYRDSASNQTIPITTQILKYKSYSDIENNKASVIEILNLIPWRRQQPLALLVKHLHEYLVSQLNKFGKDCDPKPTQLSKKFAVQLAPYLLTNKMSAESKENKHAVLDYLIYNMGMEIDYKGHNFVSLTLEDHTKHDLYFEDDFRYEEYLNF